MSAPTSVTLLPNCYVKLGLFKRAQLFVHCYDGRCSVVYPVYPGPVYIDVAGV
jgi:hypothetical protein